MSDQITRRRLPAAGGRRRTFYGVRGFSDRHALRLANGRSAFHQPDPANPDGYELPFHLDTRHSSASCVSDLSHAWDVQHAAGPGPLPSPG